MREEGTLREGSAGSSARPIAAQTPGETRMGIGYHPRSRRTGAREAEGDGLLNRCTGDSLYRGFESLPVRFVHAAWRAFLSARSLRLLALVLKHQRKPPQAATAQATGCPHGRPVERPLVPRLAPWPSLRVLEAAAKPKPENTRDDATDSDPNATPSGSAPTSMTARIPGRAGHTGAQPPGRLAPSMLPDARRRRPLDYSSFSPFWKVAFG